MKVIKKKLHLYDCNLPIIDNTFLVNIFVALTEKVILSHCLKGLFIEREKGREKIK